MKQFALRAGQDISLLPLSKGELEGVCRPVSTRDGSNIFVSHRTANPSSPPLGKGREQDSHPRSFRRGNNGRQSYARKPTLASEPLASESNFPTNEDFFQCDFADLKKEPPPAQGKLFHVKQFFKNG